MMMNTYHEGFGQMRAIDHTRNDEESEDVNTQLIKSGHGGTRQSDAYYNTRQTEENQLLSYKRQDLGSFGELMRSSYAGKGNRNDDAAENKIVN